MSRKTAPSKKSTVVVAGAAGFLGFHLTKALLELDCKVIGLDDFITGSRENVEYFAGNSNFDFLEVDLNQKLPAALFKAPITHLVHAANIETYFASPSLNLNELLINSFGVKNLLDLAVKKRARFVFTSTIGIYEGLASKTDLKHYYDGMELSSRFAYFEAKRYAEALCRQYFEGYDLDVRIARLSEIYGPGANLANNSLLSRLIRLTLSGKDLIIDEEGSRELWLTYISDVVYGIIKLLFAEEVSLAGGIFYFVNPERVSTLSIAYTLREYARLIGGQARRPLKVEFLPKTPTGLPAEFLKPAQIDLSRSRSELYWEPKIDLTEGLRLTLEYFVEKNKQQKTGGQEDKRQEGKQQEGGRAGGQEEAEKGWLFLKRKALPSPTLSLLKGVEGKGKKLSLKKIILASFFLLSILSLGPPLVSLSFGFWGLRQWQGAPFDKIGDAQRKLVLASDFWAKSRLLFLISGQKTLWQNGKHFWQALFFLSDGLKETRSDWQFLEEGTRQIAAGSSSTANLKLFPERLDLAVDSLLPRLVLAEVELSQIQNETIPPRLRDRLINLRDGVGLIKTMLTKLKPLNSFLPALLGVESSQKYLILLQNNTELRPTGGFIGSYAVLVLEGGKVSSFNINDVYNPDGLLKQKIPAPKFFEKNLAVPELGMRDANYSPDFSLSAERVAALYEFATGEKINQVVGLNLLVAQKILKAMGPIKLSDYNEEISQDNLFERAEFHSEIGFKPGSSQKRDFLTSLAAQVLSRLSQEKTNRLALASALAESLGSGEVLFYSRDPQIQPTLTQAGLSGTLKESGGDYLFVVDTNVSANKANFWVKRSTDYAIDVDREGGLVGNLTVEWKHTGQSGSWPGGDYKNYLRVYLPGKIKVLESQGFAEEPEVAIEQDKTVVGGLVKVAISSSQKISLKYILPQNLAFVNPKNDYFLLVQKQPGIENEPFSIKINLPTFLKAEGKTSFSGNLKQDQEFSLMIARE